MKKNVLFKLFRYLKKEIIPVLLTIILSVGSVVCTLIATLILRELTNTINDAALLAAESSLPMKEVLNMGEINRICFSLVGVYAASIISGFLQAFFMAGIVQRVSYRIRAEISSKINKLPLRYFDKGQVGDTLSRVTNDVDMLAQSLSSAVATTVSSVVQLILVAVMMFVTSWQMALTAIVAVPLSAVVAVVVMMVSHKYFVRQQKILGELNGKAEETYSGLALVKAYGQETRFAKDFENTNEELRKAMYKANTLSQLGHPISTFINKLGYVAVCVVGGILVSGGGTDLGALAAFLIYINLFQQPLQQLAQIMNVFQQASAAATRVFEFLEAEEQLEEHASGTLSSGMVQGNVVFDHVKFGYDEGKIIIKDFNATVKAGQKVAIVGPTGAGKTTLVNLLMRFYESEGDIRIDGISIKQMTHENVRDLFSMVLQDTWLFEGTVRENIAYTKSATDDEIMQAVKAANLTHFVRGLPEGLDTKLDEEGLSGGQKQLLTIARAMVQNSPMMILDEATSNVDTGTEEAIQKAMDALTEGRTSFVIAHRLSTIKNADIIFVLKDGDVIEQGNHVELLARKGFYAELYNSQFAQN